MDKYAELLSWETMLIVLLAFSCGILFRLLCKCAKDNADPAGQDRRPSLRLASGPAHHVSVRDILSRQLVTLAPEDSAKTAWRRLQEHRFKTLPVIENGRVVGIIALVDLLKHLGMAWHVLPEDLTERANLVMGLDVATLMSKPVRTVPADMSLAELAPLLSDTGLRRLPVVGTDGALVGMITQSDVIAGLAHMLGQPFREQS